ncbi:MAG: HlyD family secretion protein [Nanoarchaeota archaeon]
MKKQENNNLEFRSEEVQEIMGYIPHWFLRTGVSIILGILIFGLILSYFIKYPDVLIAKVSITSDTPPLNIMSRATGKMDSLLVKDKQYVEKNKILAIINNTASYNDILKIEVEIEKVTKCLKEIEKKNNIKIKQNNYVLGDIESNYLQFIKAIKDFKNFLALDYHNKKTEKLQRQINKKKKLYIIEQRQFKIAKSEFILNEKQFKRDSLLFSRKVISESKYEKSMSVYLKKTNLLENSKKSLINCELQIDQFEKEIIDLKSDYKNKLETIKTNIHHSIKKLKNAIENWRFKYILKAPISGKIVFSSMWSSNQNISRGGLVFTILPEKQNKLIGKLKLPVSGAGKVDINQEVNIKLYNYPYKEFGMVSGRVINISDIPIDSLYYVDISLPNGLKTNYQKKLHFNQGMSGEAEIITENISLLARIIHPIKEIIKNKF